MKWIARLRDAIKLPDPTNPAGGFVPPIYHLKAGAAYITRAAQGVPRERQAAVLATLAPSRFVRLGEEEPPRNRVSVLSPLVEEHWTPVCATTNADDVLGIGAFVGGGIPLAGYRVTQQIRAQHCDCAGARFTAGIKGLEHVACGRPMRSRATADIREHVLGLQIQAQDIYDGYYPTISGTDAYNDKVNTGGKRIVGGRAQYARVLKEKNYGIWDRGWQRDVDRIAAEKQTKREAKFALTQERADKSLPRKLGEV